MPFKLNTELSVRKIEEEIFIYDRKNALIHAFNDTGAFLWERVSAGDSAERLVAALVDSYETDTGSAAADVAGFIDLLRQKHLIEE